MEMFDGLDIDLSIDFYVPRVLSAVYNDKTAGRCR